MDKMFFVYLLQDDQGKIYIGFTEDLDRRFKEHERGLVYWTSRMKHPKLIYYEAYENKDKAREREKKLKIRGSAYIALTKRIGLK